MAKLPTMRSRLRWVKALGLVTVLAVSGLSVAGGPAGATTATGALPVTSGSWYLALGDSVPFGYRESTNLPPPNYPDAKSFVGYPEDVAADLSLRVRNAACPGETSSSLIDATAQSNGCESSPAGGPGYRTGFPLHVTYKKSQLYYATKFLRKYQNVRLVTLMVGANDGFLCQETTADHCASELVAVVNKIAENVTTILQQLRGRGGYTGQIVVVNYYSLDYSDPLQSGQSQVINSALDTAAEPFDVAVADGYGAFQKAAAQAGGNTCAAGLLTTLTTGGCGVHPSVAGQQLLAGAVERVVTKA